MFSCSCYPKTHKQSLCTGFGEEGDASRLFQAFPFVFFQSNYWCSRFSLEALQGLKQPWLGWSHHNFKICVQILLIFHLVIQQFACGKQPVPTGKLSTNAPVSIGKPLDYQKVISHSFQLYQVLSYIPWWLLNATSLFWHPINVGWPEATSPRCARSVQSLAANYDDGCRKMLGHYLGHGPREIKLVHAKESLDLGFGWKSSSLESPWIHWF